jgi:hypothetical protein
MRDQKVGSKVNTTPKAGQRTSVFWGDFSLAGCQVKFHTCAQAVNRSVGGG